jgi:hypothetical protein
VCGGSGKCINPLFYTTQTYTREYQADCPKGTQVIWRFFEWQATIPTGTSIALGAQSKAEAADDYAPTLPVEMDAISTTSPAGVWVHGSRTVDTVLEEGSTTGHSLAYLLITMTFKPDPTGTLTPTLMNWRQNYDCVDAE